MALHLGCVASSLVLVTLPLTDTMTLLGAGGSLWGGAGPVRCQVPSSSPHGI